MCEMRNTVIRHKNAGQDLDDSITYDEPFGLDRHEEIEVYAFFGEHHAESEKNAIYSPRCADGWVNGMREEHDKDIDEGRTDATEKIVNQEIKK